MEYPLAYVHSRDDQYNLISRLVAKGAADIPVFGTKTDKWAGSGIFGIDFYGDAALDNNLLRFFANFNINSVSGTEVFKNNLGISNKSFILGQASVGLVFKEIFKVSFIVSTISSESSLRNRNVIAGGQI
ncbi:hypothetical protein EXU57_23280 [Segetibacter sp. 3557_3]|uniref:hypothetical protein n=1 Tax=Segetibacter sp. 3557_3 TaxID=2547429 RepID=UPI0010586B04|nr:hypothetical protein [Segetibacter sp. 3557_3]TDH18389.1 hypothetical protein EXU57_23280 [Segetibacter sp. 3557_3]